MAVAVRAEARAYVQGSIPRKDRPDRDFYPTPPRATEALLDAWDFSGDVVWEPACGDGAISKVLAARKIKVHSTDIYDYGYPMRAVADFFTYEPKFKYTAIVTNPPFTHARQFAERALETKAETVAMLARLAFLEGKSRKVFWESSGLCRVLVFSSRVNIPRKSLVQEYEGKNGMVAFAWYVFRKGYEHAPTIGWL